MGTHIVDRVWWILPILVGRDSADLLPKIAIQNCEKVPSNAPQLSVHKPHQLFIYTVYIYIYNIDPGKPAAEVSQK